MRILYLVVLHRCGHWCVYNVRLLMLV